MQLLLRVGADSRKCADQAYRRGQECSDVSYEYRVRARRNFPRKMVVSMRPLPYDKIVTAVAATAAMPKVHGAPIHIGDPSVIGIKDISKPDFGDAVTINPGEVPVFWPCGVTPQSALMSTKPPIAITHSPGHMLITDVKNVELKY